MSIKKPEMILFDLDGTLVDSVPDLSRCINQMLEKLGLTRQEEERIRLWVGNGVSKLVSRSIYHSSGINPEPAQLDQALSIFDSLYFKNSHRYSTIYPGVIDFLNFLKTTNIKTGCVTNKAERFTLPLLKKLKLDHFFETIICGDTVARMKPDALPLLTAAKNMSILPEDSLMVGDSISDVNAAKNAGFDIVCVSYGYNHGVDISLAQPDAVIDSLIELKDIISW
jgi:phosphoglycolate phosphatase